MAQHSRRPPDLCVKKKPCSSPSSPQITPTSGEAAIKAALYGVIGRGRNWRLAGCLLLAASLLGGCSAGHHLFGPTTPVASPNSGIVVADEPQAALVGRDVLARGGNAADAATATALALSVTLPSRASLGGGGACLVAQPDTTPQMISFLPVAGHGTGDRPAAIPMMARGLYMLQLHYGNVQFADVIDPAIDLARYGITVSQILADDLAAVRSPLMADNAAFAVFSKDDGRILGNGDLLVQTRLTSFLARLKLVGVGDLYNGALSDVFVEQADSAGAGLTRDDLRQSLPQTGPALILDDSHLRIAFLAPPADGGLGAALAYKSSVSAESAVAAWRATGGNSLADAQKFLRSGNSDKSPVMAKNLPPLPASTSFVTSDRNGMAVACTLTENNLFGTGRIAGTTGVILAASPNHYPKPLLAAAIVNMAKSGKLRAVLASSGQNDAAQELANALHNIAGQRDARANATPQGRLNLIQCDGKECRGSADPRGNGLSVRTVR